MDFSEAYRCSGPAPLLSPDGRWLATCVEYRLILREVETLRVVQLYSCLDRIDSIEWSPNSTYVLCGVFSRGLLQIWSVESPEWSCRIDEGPAGVASAAWSPDGAAVLVAAQFGLRLAVWRLAERGCAYLRGPKHPGGGGGGAGQRRAGVAFSHDGAHLAVLERSEQKDRVSVYDTRGWGEAASFALPTSDAADLAWSPEGGLLAVWDTCLAYKVVVVDARSGQQLASYSAYGTDALGVKCCAWSPGGELLAVGSYDRHVRLLNHVTWGALLEAEHGPRVAAPAGVVVYREEPDEPVGGPSSPGPSGRAAASPGPPAASAAGSGRSRYAIAPLPVAVPQRRPALDAPAPKIGVGRCAWSGDGRYLATHEASTGGAVWVWDAAAADLAALLLHEADVTDMAWAPGGNTLVVATGAPKVYVWTPGGASIVHIPLPKFAATGCAWSSNGTTLLLRGAEAYCCAYLTA